MGYNKGKYAKLPHTDRLLVDERIRSDPEKMDATGSALRGYRDDLAAHIGELRKAKRKEIEATQNPELNLPPSDKDEPPRKHVRRWKSPPFGRSG